MKKDPRWLASLRADETDARVKDQPSGSEPLRLIVRIAPAGPHGTEATENAVLRDVAGPTALPRQFEWTVVPGPDMLQ